jgi:hypothetical protein
VILGATEVSSTVQKAMENSCLQPHSVEKEQSEQSVQKQLRCVLQEADECTAVNVQSEVGRGSSGVVYLGTWKNIQVAIKTVVFQVCCCAVPPLVQTRDVTSPWKLECLLGGLARLDKGWYWTWRFCGSVCGA